MFTPLARGGVQGWTLAVIHIVTLAALTLFLVQKSLDWDWQWIRTPLDWPILVLLVITLLATVFSVHRSGSMRALLLLCNYVTVFYLVIRTVGSPEKLYGMARLLISLGIFLAVFGLIKFSGVKIFPWFHYDDLPDFGALTSTYGNPNHMAGFFEMALPLAFGLLLGDDKGRQSTKYYVPIIFLFGTALILTMSRGGWTCGMLALIFLGLVLVFKREFPRRKTVIALTCSAVGLVLVLLSSFPAVQELLTIREVVDTAGGLDGRMQVTKAVVAMIADRPFVGFGPGTFAYSFMQYQPASIQGWYNMAHNDYVHFTAELGILFPALMIWMITALFRQGFMKLKNPSLFIRGITLGAMAGIVAILCHSVMDFNLHIPANALFFTVLCAIVAAPETTKVKA